MKLIIISLLLIITNLSQCQTSEEMKRCFKGYCVYTKFEDGKEIASLKSQQGELILDYYYRNINYTSSNNFFSVKKDGLWGLINSKGEVIIEPRFKFSLEVMNDLVVVHQNKKAFGVLDTTGVEVIAEEYEIVHLMKNTPAIIWTKKDSIWSLYDRMGNNFLEDKIVSRKSFNQSFSNDSDFVWECKSISGETLLINIMGDSIAIDKYQSILQPEQNFNAKVFILLPDKEGRSLKQAVWNNGRTKTEAVYKEICFNPECLEPFKQAIPYVRIENRNCKAIGILPNNDVHLIDHDGGVLQVKN